jgi:hypothetical protein
LHSDALGAKKHSQRERSKIAQPAEISTTILAARSSQGAAAMPHSTDPSRAFDDALQPPAEGLGQASHDPRALRILAKTIYRELRQSGLVEEDVMSVAGELLSLVAGDMKDRRTSDPRAELPVRSLATR